MATDSEPEYVYKIVPEAPPQPIPEDFPLSELDREDGFIHLSTAQQAPLTCDRFYANASTLWVLKFELAMLTGTMKWEAGFPHLYGNFGQKDVLSVQKFERKESSLWTEVMEGSTWLE